MSNPEIINKKPLGLAEVKSTLKKIHKRDEELTFRGGKTEDYINEVTVTSEKHAKDALKKLEGLEIGRIKPEHWIKIIDIMPESAEHLKIVMSGFNVTLKKEDLTKIVDALDEFRSVKK